MLLDRFRQMTAWSAHLRGVNHAIINGSSSVARSMIIAVPLRRSGRGTAP